MQTHTETITRLRAVLAQLEPDHVHTLAHWSAASEIFRPDCDVEWLEQRALGGLVSALVIYASHRIDALPEVESKELPPATIAESTRVRLNVRLRQQRYRDRGHKVSSRAWWVMYRLGVARDGLIKSGTFREEMTREQAHELLREHAGEAAVALFESEEADAREDERIVSESKRDWSYRECSRQRRTASVVWSLDHLDGFLAWLPERLAAVEPVPELIDLADRAAQHAHAFRCARLDFRRTYGRQPRKAEALALGPWMQHVERYRQRAEQLCAGRPELLRWYLDHIDIVVAAPSWTSYEIGTSREHGRRLLLQAEAATTSHPARAVVS